MKLLNLPKRYTFVFLLVLSLLVMPSAFAAALSLDKIGALATEGHKYTNWWYSGSSPTLFGKGTAGSTVSVKIDDVVVGTATVDASENWSLATSMTDGDHNVVITSGAESYSFKLSLNNGTGTTASTIPASTAPGTQVPVTGSSQIVSIAVGASLMLVGYYVYYTHTSDYRKKHFEDSVRSSLK